MQQHHSKDRPHRKQDDGWFPIYVAVFSWMAVVGYLMGYLTRDLFVTQSGQHSLQLDSGIPSVNEAAGQHSAVPTSQRHRWKGDTIHSVFTSSGDAYMNWQTRIMYASYKLVQKEPGGERLTGFTRILHRTVPDVLMDEVPTFMAKPTKPQCDAWCDYPVANRPGAIKQFFEAAARNESMIQGAWVFMLESDYVWMQPMQVPGDAWDPSVPGVQFLYDYIMPTHPNAIEAMRKLYNGDPKDVPASGPSPVLMRLADWQKVVPTYYELATNMEFDDQIKKSLEWVREMYAWDAAIARHKDVHMRTEHPPNSTTIVQPPFDEGLGPAAMCHYTWGVLFHEGLPSKGAKQVFRFEKRDYSTQEQVLKINQLKVPPPYQDGWILEFDAPLNPKRHALSALMINQINRAIATLPDLTEHWHQFEPLLHQYERDRDRNAIRDAALMATDHVVTATHRRL